MELIRSFSKISKSDVALAGGKGASLGEMTRTGLPVPPGFVVLSTAFDRFIEETDLDVEIEAAIDKVNINEIHTTEDASEKIKALILGAKMPRDLAKKIIYYFKKLKSEYVAVRSSATSEDSSTAAWAGQLESYLNTTEKTLLENVKKCWASLFTPRAIFYRFEKKLTKEKISVAVVIQKMIESETSGVAFSVHPVNQDQNQLLIEGSFGLGEAIVSGQVTPDSYVVDKKPLKIINKNVIVQERGLYRSPKGGSIWKTLPKEIGEKRVLSDKEILELSKIILKIESHYRFPCDIEWAREKGKFYIVQSRPITTLLKSDKEKYKETKIKEEWEELIRSDLCAYNTCIGMHSIKFSNTYMGGPKYEKLFLYIKDNVGYYYENFADHYKVGNYLLKVFLKDRGKFKNYINFWKEEFGKLNKIFSQVRNTDLAKKSNKELAEMLEKVYYNSIKWHGIAYNVDSIDTMLNPIIDKIIKEVYSKEKKSKQSEVYNKITFPDVLSYVNRMNLEKLNLFIAIKKDKTKKSTPAVKKFLDNYYWINFSLGPSNEYSEKELFDEYNKIKIEKVKDELKQAERNIEQSLKEKEKVINFIASKQPIILDYIDIFDKYAVLHDLRKEGQVKAFYFMRQIYEEFARRFFIDRGLFYYLWPTELISTVREKNKPDINLLERRSKEYFYAYTAEAGGKEFFGVDAEKERSKILNLEEGAKELNGIGTSQGRIIGNAKVCLSVKDALNNIKEGNILVTGMTMPDFVPAMKRAAAIVTDEGGISCHAAIIARELNKPCVVGTKMATRLIKDGDLIEVNANHGVVKILKKA